MNALSKAVITIGVVGLLAGCSTMPTGDGARRAVELDAQRVAAVNAAAKQAGVTVYWVNPPTKKN